MEKRKTFATALSGVLVGGLLLSGGMVFAGDANSSVPDKLTGKMPFFGQAMKHRGGMAFGKGHFMAGRGMLSQAVLDQLVKDGVITQDKAAEIKAYIDKMAQERQAGDPGSRRAGRQDLFTELVNNNILTQEQADTIKTKLTEAAQKQNQQRISDSLKILVEKGTITQEQSDKILKQFEDAKKDREVLAQKMENMTLKEIRQYMQDNQGKPQNPINQLVSDGVINQEQADAFRATMKETAQKQNQQRISDSLKALVEKGTITQEQSDKILKKLEDTRKDREALFDKTKDMTPDERRQYMQDNKEKPQDPISQLVADGTITEDQAKAIGEILPHQKGFKGGRR